MRGFDNRLTSSSSLAKEWADNENTVPLFMALAKEMASVSESKNAKILFVLAHHMLNYGKGPTQMDLDVRAGLEKAGFAVLDTYELVNEEVNKGRDLFIEDGHWNEEGHKLIADAIRNDFVKRRWLE
jgi:hypothetical protein